MAINLSSLFKMKNVGFEVSGGTVWKMISAGEIALVERGYIVDTSGGVVTLALPTSMVKDDFVSVKDLKGTFKSNNLTIAQNGHKIQGLAEDLICDVDNMSFTLTYSDVTTGLVIVDGAW